MSDLFGDPQIYSTDQYDPRLSGFDWWDGEQPAEWWDDEVVLSGMDEQGAYYLHDLTVADWFDLLAQDDDFLIREYGLDHYDIIDQLGYEGYWEDEDWERYGEAHGSPRAE